MKIVKNHEDKLGYLFISMEYLIIYKFTINFYENRDFYELWQQNKHLKIMKMSQAWPDTYNKGYIHQSQPEPTHKIH